MKKLLIIIFAFIAIECEAQTFDFLKLSRNIATSTGTRWSSGTDINIISKDTIISDTTKLDYFAIDTTDYYILEEYKAYNKIFFIRGYRVDVRKGEYSSSMVQTGCDNPGCLVLHFKTEYIKPDVIKTYYLTGIKKELGSGWLIEEMPLCNLFIKGL
jgi:hypothetical protein